jgi:hypothetical protein
MIPVVFAATIDQSEWQLYSQLDNLLQTDFCPFPYNFLNMLHGGPVTYIYELCARKVKR